MTMEETRSKRVADAIELRIEYADSTASRMPETHVVNLSTSDMRFSYASKLPADSPLKVYLSLGHKQVVLINAQVADTAENLKADSNGLYATRLMFTNVDQQTQQVLEQHIDQIYTRTRVLKELPYRRSA